QDDRPAHPVGTVTLGIGRLRVGHVDTRVPKHRVRRGLAARLVALPRLPDHRLLTRAEALLGRVLGGPLLDDVGTIGIRRAVAVRIDTGRTGRRQERLFLTGRIGASRLLPLFDEEPSGDLPGGGPRQTDLDIVRVGVRVGRYRRLDRDQLAGRRIRIVVAKEI